MKPESQCQWLVPVILATWESEIGRIRVLGQSRQMFTRPHLQNIQSKNVAYVSLTLGSWGMAQVTEPLAYNNSTTDK
jgi:hypothetical protein